MNTITLIVASVLGLFLLYFLARLSWSISVNVINGLGFYRSLEKELGRLRLNRMLEALGINKGMYIHQNAVSDIRQQMENCASCHNTEECDEKLARGELEADEIDFCNNEASLQEIKKRQMDALSEKSQT